MLEKLLAELRTGGTFETGELAVRLGTSPELLGAMLEHLQRSGHIRSFDTCNDACAECSLGKTCRPQTDGSPDKEMRLYSVNIS
jgi:FeoC like transcriptional regulator